MTMGIVLVALLGRADRDRLLEKRISTLRAHELGDNSPDAVSITLGEAILKQDIFAFRVTEVLQRLLEYLDIRARLVGIAAS